MPTDHLTWLVATLLGLASLGAYARAALRRAAR